MRLARTPLLRFATGDVGLDGKMISRKFFVVIIGYRCTWLLKAAGPAMRSGGGGDGTGETDLAPVPSAIV